MILFSTPLRSRPMLARWAYTTNSAATAEGRTNWFSSRRKALAGMMTTEAKDASDEYRVSPATTTQQMQKTTAMRQSSTSVMPMSEATAFPPLKASQHGKRWPKKIPDATSRAVPLPPYASASATGIAPLAKSPARTAAPAALPAMRSALVAPVPLDPRVRISPCPVARNSKYPNETEPMRYAPSQSAASSANGMSSNVSIVFYPAVKTTFPSTMVWRIFPRSVCSSKAEL